VIAEHRRLVVLRAPGAVCAMVASDLLAIDHDGAAARVPLEDPVVDLAQFVPGCRSSEHPSVRLLIEIAGRVRGFRVRADLELVETAALYRMPRVLRGLGCAPWLLGVVVLDALPTLWIDLARLAKSASHQETC
jgi:hypothetical protein